MTEQDTESFQKMWSRGGFMSEARAAWAISINVWKIELSYPLSVLWFVVMPFLWFIPMLITGAAVAGGSESAVLNDLVGTADWITYIAIGTSILGLTISIMWGTGFSLRREQNAGTLETLMNEALLSGDRCSTISNTEVLESSSNSVLQ